MRALKISKTGWIILGVGIGIIALASLGAVRLGQLQEQSRLREGLPLAKLELKGVQLEGLVSQQQELEQRLSQTLSQFETAKAMLSPSIESINLTDTLFEIAETCEVEITRLSSTGLTSGDLNGITCSVLPLTVRVEGEVTSLISFIARLNSDLTTAVLNSVEISVSEPTADEKPSATIGLAIYTYQGD